MNIAIIPARGGSKRIPYKNIREFCGKPIIAWSIEAALESGCFNEVVVSTDDETIAEVAKAYGASVPFIRPACLSDDHTGTIPVIRHAIEWFSDFGQTVDAACCLYATAPFVNPSDLREGLATLKSTHSAFAFPVASFTFPIQRALRLLSDHRVEMFDSSQFDIRSQDLEEAWHDAGQFYWGTARAWQSGQVIFSSESVGIPIPRYRVQDIDTLEDWESAELLFEMIKARVRRHG